MDWADSIGQYVVVLINTVRLKISCLIINIQIVVVLPLYPKKVGLAKPRGDAACWTVGMDWLGIEECHIPRNSKLPLFHSVRSCSLS